MGRLGVFNINIWILLLLGIEGLRVKFDICVKNLGYYDLFFCVKYFEFENKW